MYGFKHPVESILISLGCAALGLGIYFNEWGYVVVGLGLFGLFALKMGVRRAATWIIIALLSFGTFLVVYIPRMAGA